MSGFDTEMATSQPYQFNDPVQRIVVAVVTALASCVGLIGNFLVIIAILFSKKLQTKTNVFVTNLAIADLVSCCLLPFQVVALLIEPWPLSGALCTIVGMLTWICLWTSNVTLALIAYNRYNIVLKKRDQYEEIYKTWKMSLWILFSWILPTSLVTIPPAFDFGAMGYSTRYKVCTADTSHPKSDWYALLSSVTIQVPCLVVIILSYTLLFRHVKLHNQQMLELFSAPSGSRKITTQDVEEGKISQGAIDMQRHLFRRQHQITKNLFVVVCSFMVCIMPFGIACLIPPSYPVIPWVSMLVLVNSCINPIIYGLKHPQFNEVLRPLIFCHLKKIPQPSKVLVIVDNQSPIRDK